LLLLGDLTEEEKGGVLPAQYQGALVAAVKRFQQRHGLEPNGLIDVQTVKDLNTPLSRLSLNSNLHWNDCDGCRISFSDRPSSLTSLNFAFARLTSNTTGSSL